jgi:hypothetical protein
MNHFKFYISALLLILVAISCTKVIDLKLGDQAGKLVIEGNITSVHAAQVIKLSQNVPFTNTNVYPPVTGATVTVSDGFNTVPFTEGTSGTYSANRFVGAPGVTYTMTVVTGGKTYTASSTMPQRVSLDSVTESKTIFNSSKNIREISVHFHDPIGIPNQYNFIMYVNNVQVKSIFAYNDDFTDGRDVDIDLVENSIDVYPGDTVTVEMQCIDKNIYAYWSTLMQQSNNFGQGVTPSDPPTNITPATLGYFSAHTSQTKTIIVK